MGPASGPGLRPIHLGCSHRPKPNPLGSGQGPHPLGPNIDPTSLGSDADPTPLGPDMDPNRLGPHLEGPKPAWVRT
jgi:hypothetical protein